MNLPSQGQPTDAPPHTPGRRRGSTASHLLSPATATSHQLPGRCDNIAGMSDRTEQQSSEEQRQAQDLSLKRTRPPAEIPGYEIQQFLGSGAYGEVWVGIDQNTGRRVAIKFYTHQGGVD